MTGNYYEREGIKPIFSYRCNQYRLNKICTNKMALNEKKIERQLLDNLDQYISNEVARVKSISEKKSAVIDNSKKIEEIKKEMKRLTIAYRKGRVEEDEYDKDYAELESELKKLEAVEKPEEKDLTALKSLAESNYRTIYDALDKPHKKAFWRSIIKEFVVDETRQIVPDSIIFF
jgi:septal ring factor EnvC (AmiA/AmiB activator)